MHANQSMGQSHPTANGELHPLYVIYKSEHLWGSWCEGGPKSTRFRTAGWIVRTLNVELLLGI